MVGAQVLETALDAASEHRGIPIRRRVTGSALGRRAKRRMPALRHQNKLRTAMGNRLSNQRLAVGIALSRIDHVDSGVERGIQNFIDSLLCDRLVANLGAAKSKRTDSKPGLSQRAVFDCHKFRRIRRADARGKGDYAARSSLARRRDASSGAETSC